MLVHTDEILRNKNYYQYERDEIGTFPSIIVIPNDDINSIKNLDLYMKVYSVRVDYQFQYIFVHFNRKSKRRYRLIIYQLYSVLFNYL